METEIEVLKGRLSVLEMRLALVEEQLHARPAPVVLAGSVKPIEIFVADENLANFHQAIQML